MSIKDILLATYIALSKLSKNKLLKALQSLREKYNELEETITQLKAENAKLKEQLKSDNFLGSDQGRTPLNKALAQKQSSF